MISAGLDIRRCDTAIDWTGVRNSSKVEEQEVSLQLCRLFRVPTQRPKRATRTPTLPRGPNITAELRGYHAPEKTISVSRNLMDLLSGQLLRFCEVKIVNINNYGKYPILVASLDVGFFCTQNDMTKPTDRFGRGLTIGTMVHQGDFSKIFFSRFFCFLVSVYTGNLSFHPKAEESLFEELKSSTGNFLYSHRYTDAHLPTWTWPSTRLRETTHTPRHPRRRRHILSLTSAALPKT
ncbi:hypothetical protein BDV95DRAFT_204668 [Massariosphaeria phaeospora]|uniref:Uncharacterized protein n=1 Tax=Massariosphaeria phaeospora TaxID=100035 RepID=A0A7C8I2S9_9PLEO|nr:hypothetical protein BDV95DRAFT_204668 [Massariosphaeria phaeospora]